MFTIILLIPLLTYLPNQELKVIQPTNNPVTQEPTPAPFKCTQSAAEQDALFREAAENQYRVRRVEFVGNENTRDNVLRRRITLQEGDLFTRENLLESLVSVNQLKKIIYPVEMIDVIVHMDKPGKTVDLTICFEERRKTRRGAKPDAGKRAS